MPPGASVPHAGRLKGAAADTSYGLLLRCLLTPLYGLLLCCRMGAIASKPSASYKGYILGGLMWFSM
jgi:hypothetical protein